MDKYTRMMQLNNHIQEQFKKKLKEIKKTNISSKKEPKKRVNKKI